MADSQPSFPAAQAQEEWRPIDGYSSLYEVSNFGRIRSSCTFSPGELSSGEWRLLKPVNGSRGYLMVGLHKSGKVKIALIHVLVARAFLGPCPAGYEINHKDLNKQNPHIDNLEYVTRSENVRHAIRNGLGPIGERHPKAKLTKVKAEEIRAIYKAGNHTQRQLAKQFGMSQRTICRLVRGESYREDSSY